MKKILFTLIIGLLIQASIYLSPAKSGSLSPESPNNLTGEDKNYLLNLARETLIRYLKGEPLPRINLNELSPELRQVRGCFVTLEKNGNLRGCIGYIQPIKPLCECVRENAINAATQDPRFFRVKLDELDSITIEISALTVPKKLAVKNRNMLLDALVPGKDGVILRQDQYSATFLPQVWEHFPDKESFLAALCEKAGMSPLCWQDERTEVFIYHAEVFKENRH
jgi:AmmeMemoRadiSam system protein A